MTSSCFSLAAADKIWLLLVAGHEHSLASVTSLLPSALAKFVKKYSLAVTGVILNRTLAQQNLFELQACFVEALTFTLSAAAPS